MPAKKSSSAKSTSSTSSAATPAKKKSRTSSQKLQPQRLQQLNHRCQVVVRVPERARKGFSKESCCHRHTNSSTSPNSTSNCRINTSTDSSTRTVMGWHPDPVHQSYNPLASSRPPTHHVSDLKTLQKDVQRYMREANRKQKRKRKTATPADGVKRPPAVSPSQHSSVMNSAISSASHLVLKWHAQKSLSTLHHTSRRTTSRTLPTSVKLLPMPNSRAFSTVRAMSLHSSTSEIHEGSLPKDSSI